MNNTTNILKVFSIFYITLIIVSFGCSKASINLDNSPAVSVLSTLVVNTDSVNSITSFSANCIGSITSDGGSSITAKGFVWSTSTNPTIDLVTKTNEGSGTLAFNSIINNLNQGTKYYIRAYATNSKGTTYGKEVNFTTTSPKIYVVGSFLFKGILWLNGVQNLVDSPAVFNSMVIAGNDLYIAGIKFLPSGGTIATLWKNGVASNLTGSSASSIFVSGNDIYIAGAQTNNYSTQATTVVLWKNGIKSSLTDGNNLADAMSVCVVGTDVYVAGYELNSSKNFVAKVWKNGAATNLSNGNALSIAYSVKNIGQDIYVGGFDNGVAKIWKNGVATNLNDGSNYTRLTSMFVSGNDLYATGYTDTIINSNRTYVGKIWKNGVLNSIIKDSSNDIELFSIYVYGNDVYVTGTSSNQTNGQGTGKYGVKLWKNGVATNLDGDFASYVYIQ